MAILEHRGDCVGSWIHLPGERVIACEGCGRRYPSTRERRFVAVFEEILDARMRRLAGEGAAMLDAERGR